MWPFRPRCSNRLAIFTYHGVIASPLPFYDWCFVEEDTFRFQIGRLRKRFQVLPLREAVERLRDRKIRKPTAAITFDDGFQNNHDVAFPILRKADVPATLFPVSGVLGTTRTLWFCMLNRALAQTRLDHLDWHGERLDVNGPAEKAAASSRIEDLLKELPHPQLETETRALVETLGDDPEAGVEASDPFRMLDHESMRRMTDSGLIELGGHTHTHAILSRLSEEQQETEITTSLEAIQALQGRRCDVFAYPNGRDEDFNEATVRILSAAGISVAVTAVPGANDEETSALRLRRYGIGANLTSDGFERMIERIVVRDLGRGG